MIRLVTWLMVDGTDCSVVCVCGAAAAETDIYLGMMCFL